MRVVVHFGMLSERIVREMEICGHVTLAQVSAGNREGHTAYAIKKWKGS